MVFVIGGIILGILSGGFIGLCFANMPDNSKKSHKIAIVIASIVAMSAFCILGLQGNSYNFNNGLCVKCGTQYETVTRRQGQTYYECPNCHFGCWY